MRVARLIGLVGALAYAVGFVLVSSVPGGGEVDPGAFEDFYVTDKSTTTPLLGLFVLTIGAMAVLWFLHDLRTVLGTAMGGFGWAACALGFALVLAGGSVLIGPSGVQAFSDADFVGQPVAHALAQAGFGAMLVPGSLLLGLGVAVLCLAGRSTGVLVGWVAVAGLVAAALQLVAFIWIPALAIPLWVVLASIVGDLSPDRVSPAT